MAIEHCEIHGQPFVTPCVWCRSDAKKIADAVAAERAACAKVFEDCNDPETAEFLLNAREEADRLGR